MFRHFRQVSSRHTDLERRDRTKAHPCLHLEVGSYHIPSRANYRGGNYLKLRCIGYSNPSNNLRSQRNQNLASPHPRNSRIPPPVLAALSLPL